MTRFARQGAGRKKPLEASEWKDMKSGSQQKSEGNQSGSQQKSEVNQSSQGQTEHQSVTPVTQGSESNTPLKGVEHTQSFKQKDGLKKDKNNKNRFDKKFKGGNSDMKKDYSTMECYNCHQKGHRASDCTAPSDGKHADIVCHKCKELGHKAFRCPKFSGSNNGKAQGGGGAKNRPIKKFEKFGKELKEEWNKEKRSEWRRQKRQTQVDNKKLCFNCREPGHQLSECPNIKKDVEQGTGICFKCGSTEHAISSCKIKLPAGEFPYAKCFICKETGHLSRQCPDNPRGLYPNGGCCNECGSVEHLRRDCPDVHKQQGIGDMLLQTLGTDQSADSEALVAMETTPTVTPSNKPQKQKKTKLVKF